MTYGNVLAAVSLLPFVAGDLSVSPRSLSILALLGVFQLAGAYALFVRASGTFRRPGASLIGMIEPVANPIWVFLFLGERPSRFAIAGGGDRARRRRLEHDRGRPARRRGGAARLAGSGFEPELARRRSPSASRAGGNRSGASCPETRMGDATKPTPPASRTAPRARAVSERAPRAARAPGPAGTPARRHRSSQAARAFASEDLLERALERLPVLDARRVGREARVLRPRRPPHDPAEASELRVGAAARMNSPSDARKGRYGTICACALPCRRASAPGHERGLRHVDQRRERRRRRDPSRRGPRRPSGRERRAPQGSRSPCSSPPADPRRRRRPCVGSPSGSPVIAMRPAPACASRSKPGEDGVRALAPEAGDRGRHEPRVARGEARRARGRAASSAAGGEVLDEDVGAARRGSRTARAPSALARSRAIDSLLRLTER